MNLIGITFHGDRPNGFPSLSYFDLRTPNHGLAGWRIQIRGVRVFFISPRGWKRGMGKEQWDKKGPSEIMQVPLSSMSLHWEGDGETMPPDSAQWPVVKEGEEPGKVKK
jgi:hypothetical protein